MLLLKKEEKIQVMRFSGQWKDLGTWNTLTESMDENIIGKGIESDKCQNTHIVNGTKYTYFMYGIKRIW